MEKIGGPEKFLTISVAVLSFLGILFLIVPEAGLFLSETISGYFTRSIDSNDILFLYFISAVAVFIANASVFIYIPYPLIIFALAAKPEINPIILILASSIGAAIGEFSAYALGYAGKKMIENKEKYRKQMETMKKLLEKKPYLVPILIFFMAVTPLPDDVILIPLGLIGYGLVRGIIPCFLGKLALIAILVLGGRIFGETVAQFITSSEEGPYPWLDDLIILYIVVIIIYIVLKIDFSKLVKRFGISEEILGEE